MATKYKIYKIVNSEDDYIYIGSTKQPLYKRWNDHKKRWRRKDLTQYRSSILFDKYGYEKCKIILIEEFDFINEEERNKKEQEFIDKFKNICVNKNHVFITEEYLKEKIKGYTEKYKENTKIKRSIKGKEKVNCCCGKILSKYSLSRHLKIFHQDDLKTALEYVKK